MTTTVTPTEGSAAVTAGRAMDAFTASRLRDVDCVESASKQAAVSSSFRRAGRWLFIPGTIVAIAAVLASVPGLARIAPLVESDYCYQFLAADHMFAGVGPTSMQPVAPNQPWDWSYDWGFLTQWPIGYPALVYATRLLTGWTSLDAARLLSIFSCAAALVGWFVWLGRCVPCGVTRWLVALVGAASAIPVTSLTNPSTDAIVIAVLPFLLLLAENLVRSNKSKYGRRHAPAWLRAVVLGLGSGGLCWIRYASMFVPVALGLFLLIECVRKRVSLNTLIVSTISSIVPIALLVIVNQTFGNTSSAAAAFNLGSTVTPAISPSIIAEAWSTYTALGYFNHRPWVGVALTTWPVVAVVMFGIIALFRRARQNTGSVAGRSSRTSRESQVRPSPRNKQPARSDHTLVALSTPTTLNTCVLVIALMMLVLTTMVFGAKYHYVGLERYYLPIRPLYVALFVAPLLACRSRLVHGAVAGAALLALAWTAQVDWTRAYERASLTQGVRSPYGQSVRCFTPNPRPLFDWLSARNNSGLVVVSNYHEYLTLETGIPALPIPHNREQLARWLNRIKLARSVNNLDLLFVLDPVNRWRSHWIPPPEVVARTFDLKNPVVKFDVCDTLIYRYEQSYATHHAATARR